MPPALIPGHRVADLYDILRYNTRSDDPAVQARIIWWLDYFTAQPTRETTQ